MDAISQAADFAATSNGSVKSGECPWCNDRYTLINAVHNAAANYGKRFAEAMISYSKGNTNGLSIFN